MLCARWSTHFLEREMLRENLFGGVFLLDPGREDEFFWHAFLVQLRCDDRLYPPAHGNAFGVAEFLDSLVGKALD